MYKNQISFFKNSWYLYKDFPWILKAFTTLTLATEVMKTKGFSDLQITNEGMFLQGAKIKKFNSPFQDLNNEYFLYAVFLLMNQENITTFKYLTETLYNYIKTIVSQKVGAETDIEFIEKLLEESYEQRGNEKTLKGVVKKILNVFLKYEVPYYPIGYKASDGVQGLIQTTEAKYYDLMEAEITKIVEGLYSLKESEELFYENSLKNFETKKFFDFSFKQNIGNETTSFRGIMDIIGNNISYTIRIIWKPLPLEQLFVYGDSLLRDTFLDMFTKKEGLIIVSWPTGSGKTTFLMSMVEHMNKEDSINKVVFTLEDPIEYYFNSKKYFFLQKNVGIDINNFEEGIMVALRKHPDIIMVGETRNKETVHWLLTASETGHLSISTLHLTHPRDVITRIKSLAGENKDMVLNQLSKSLVGIVNVNLLKIEKEVQNENGEKVKQTMIVPYYEVLKNSPQVEVLISRGDVESLKNIFFEVRNINEWTTFPRELYLLRLNQKYPDIFTKEIIERNSDQEVLEDMQNKYAYISVFNPYQ